VWFRWPGASSCAADGMRDRRQVLADWARLLTPGGRLLFTDPLTVTGMLGSDEIATRTSFGYGLFVPLGENERLLAEVGLSVVTVEDTTESTAAVARRRYDARAQHETTLRQAEGDETFEGSPAFLRCRRHAGQRTPTLAGRLRGNEADLALRFLAGEELPRPPRRRSRACQQVRMGRCKT
jgi:SAM-dependent methyltransferase